MSEVGSFTQWLRALILGTLRTYQFDTNADADNDLADPIHAPVLLNELESAKRSYEADKERQRDADRLVLEYLESMSVDELWAYFEGRRSKKRIDVARQELVTRLRKGYLD